MQNTVLPVLVVALISNACQYMPVQSKLLMWNDNCNIWGGTCRKGDLVDPSIADCSYQRSWPWIAFAGKREWSQWSCTAAGNTGSFIGWVIEEDKDGKCLPVVRDKQFRCGDSGTNTRCVCNDYKFWPNTCRCQYWTEETPGENEPSFCTTYYMGGISTVHQYVCCNNCKDYDSSMPVARNFPIASQCDSHTYQGGSDEDYCDSCGAVKGGGIVKYFFNCGNCEIQSKCEERCNSKWRWFYSQPGLCWLWANCFRKCCISAIKQP